MGSVATDRPRTVSSGRPRGPPRTQLSRVLTNMTTIDTHATGATVPSGGASVVTNTTESVPLEGVLGWLTTADHKRIGRMFIGVGLLATLTVAALGILLALDRMIT